MTRTIAVALLAVALWPGPGAAETVVARRRLGNSTEGMTYDPVRDRAYAVDGNDVIAISFRADDDLGGGPAPEISGLGFRKVFDVLALDPVARTPRGIVWVPEARRFFFTAKAAEAAARLFSTDAAGRPLPPLSLSGLDTSDWLQWEGLAWIPPGAPAHGGTIAGLGARVSDGLSRVFFLRLDGTLEAEVLPQAGTPLEAYLCGLQYWPQRPGTLLVSDCGASGTYAMDAATGTLVGDPGRPLLHVPEAGDVESVVVRRNGQVLLAGYDTGRLHAFGRSLARTPGEDRLFVVGLGVSASRLAWNPEAQELVAVTPRGVFALSPDLGTSRLLFDLDVNQEVSAVQGIAFLGGGRLALTSGGPRGVDVARLDDGHSLSRLVFSGPAFPPGPVSRPSGVGALGADQLLLRMLGDPTDLRVVSLDGEPSTDPFRDGVVPGVVGVIPLSVPAQGREAQLVDLGGPRIFTGAELYDLAGTLVHRIDQASLGLQGGPLLNGAWLFGNVFAAVDGQTSTVVVYTVP